MSTELRELKRRIGSARQIRKVTSALQRMSAARLVRNRHDVERAGPYVARLRELLAELVLSCPEAQHDWLRPRPAGPAAIVVFGSDRGLCGGYHTAILDALASLRDRHPAGGLRLAVVGRIVARRARRLQWPVDRQFRQPGRAERPAALDELASWVAAKYRSGEYRAVDALYTRFLSGIRQQVVVEPLLPLPTSLPARAPGKAGSPRPAPPLGGALFEPEPGRILERVLPECLRRSLDLAFLHSVASEDAARQLAMTRASDNAMELLNELLMTYSRVRQDTITTQMIELAGSSMPAPAR